MIKRRGISFILALALLISAVPVPALAETEQGNGLCQHHTAHTGCSYAEAAAEVACGHVHTADCKKVTQKCVHEHTGECYPPVEEGDEPSGEATACAHVGFCSVESGCLTEEDICTHTAHDAACGYAAAKEAVDCDYVCVLCEDPEEEGAQPQLVTLESIQDDMVIQLYSKYVSTSEPDIKLMASWYADNGKNLDSTVVRVYPKAGAEEPVYTEIVSGGNIQYAPASDIPAGEYYFDLEMTFSDGSQGTAQTECFRVVKGAVPRSAHFVQTSASVGTSVDVIMPNNMDAFVSWELHLSKAGSEDKLIVPGNTFVPTEPGTYTGEAIITNNLGEVFTVSIGTLTVDNELRLYQISITPGGRNPAAGRPVEITVTTQGQGTASSLTYEIRRDGPSGPTVANGSFNLPGFTYTFPQEGPFHVTLKMTNANGVESTANCPVTAVAPGLRIFDVRVFESDGCYVDAVTTLEVMVSGTGEIGLVEYEIFRERLDGDLVEQGQSKEPMIDWTPKEQGLYAIRVTLTDDMGNVSTDTLEVMVQTGKVVQDFWIQGHNNAMVGTPVTFDGEIAGQGEIQQLLFEVYENDLDGNVVHSEDVTQFPIVWTPKEKGEYEACLVVLGDNDHVSFRTVKLFVFDTGGLMVSGIAYITNWEPQIDELVEYVIATSGEGEIDNILYEVGWRNPETNRFEEYQQPVSSDSLRFSFVPKKPGDYDLWITLTDTNGNKSEWNVWITAKNSLSAQTLDMDSAFGQYTLGQTVKMTLNTEGDGEVQNVLYEIRDILQDKVVHTVSSTTSLTLEYKPDYASQFECRACLTDANGDESEVFCAFEVQDSDSCIEGVRVSQHEADLGADITFTAVLSGNLKPVQLTYTIANAEGKVVKTETFTEPVLEYTYKAADYGTGWCCTVTAVFENGSCDQESAWFSILNDNSNSFAGMLGVESGYTAQVGETLRFTALLENDRGMDAVEELSWKVYDETGKLVYQKSTVNATLTYTPTIPGSYTLYPVLVDKNGHTVEWGGIELYVTENLVAEALAFDQISAPVNTQVGITIHSSGTGQFQYTRFSLRDETSGKTTILYEGTADSCTFTPATPGRYSCSAMAINKENVIYMLETELTAPLNVYDPAGDNTYLTGLKSSAYDVYIGEQIDFQMEIEGKAADIKESHYRISYRNQPDDQIVASFDNVSGLLHWVPEQFGIFNVIATIVDKNGLESEAGTIVLVRPPKTTVFGGDVQSSMDLQNSMANTLEKEAETLSDLYGITVFVTMEIETVAVDQTDAEQKSIILTAGDKQLNLVNIVPYLWDENGQLIGESHDMEYVQELQVKFDFSGKDEIAVYREHGGQCTAFVQLDQRPENPVDGTFYADEANGYVYVYSDKFSLFGVGFTESKTVSPVISGLPAGASVEIGGKAYTAGADGKIPIDPGTEQLAFSYSYGASASEDPAGVAVHQQYPTSMDVWYLRYDEKTGEYRAEKIEELTKFLTYKGTSIRWSTDPGVKTGIRVITAVPEIKREELLKGTLLKETALEGYRLVEYGTLIKRADRPGDLVYGGANVQSSYAYRSGDDRQFQRSGGEIWYTGAFVGLAHDLCDDELLLRSYMILEKNGQQVVIYGGILQRNIGYVAYQNKDYKPSQEVSDFIWGIIRAVYGDKVKG